MKGGDGADGWRNSTASAHGAGKPVLVRVRNVRHVEAALNAGADILYLGGGLMSDLAVLNEAGSLNIPLVLCKDKHHSAEDWLNAAEYVVSRGNRHLILGESGVLKYTKVSLPFGCRIHRESPPNQPSARDCEYYGIMEYLICRRKSCTAWQRRQARAESSELVLKRRADSRHA